MKNQLEVSVIIPMYNESRYLQRCLDSLLKQTFKNFELIIVDDWSTDNSIEIVESYELKFKKLIIFKQHHWGPWKARNLWAKHAIWNILVFVDADMFFDKKYIEELINPIQEKNEIGTIHWTEFVGNLENKIARAYWIIRAIYNPKHTRFWAYRAIQKEVFINHWWFDSSKWYFDDDLSRINNGLGALSIEKAICYHNNPETLSEVFKHSVWVWKWLIESWQIKNYTSKYIMRLVTFFLFVVISFYFIGNKFINPLFLCVIILLLLIIIKTIERTIKERYFSHLLFVPTVILTRWIWYIVWIIKFIISNNFKWRTH